MRSMPAIAIFPDKFDRGAKTLTDDVRAATIAGFEDAFESVYATDAHFVSYIVTGQDTWPRLTKPLLGAIRQHGADVLNTCLVLDYDNPGHRPWQPGEWDAFVTKLDAVADVWPPAFNFTLLYATKKGARLVYVLDVPIPCTDFESHHIWFVQKFTEQGIRIDPDCSDWTRYFRLPAVTRQEGSEFQKTWEADYFQYISQYDKRLSAASLGVAAKQKKALTDPNLVVGQVEEITSPKPTADECEAMLSIIAPTGRRQSTEFYKAAKTRLKNRECFPCCFEHRPIAEAGSRDSTIVKYVGQAVAMLSPLPSVTPQHIYALFLGAVEQLDPDQQTPDWTNVLWSAVKRLWAKEGAKIHAEAAAKVEAMEAAQTNVVQGIESIADGMRQWVNPKHAPDLFSENQEVVQAWVSRHLLVSTGTSFQVMGLNGYYDSMSLSQVQLMSRIRILGLDRIIQTTKFGQDGGVIDVPMTQIINEHCTLCSNIRAMPEIAGAFVEGIDTPTAQMVIPSYRRNKALVPTYDPEVDEWLRRLFGSDYEAATKWISWALAWDDGPICALSISGSAGSGKKMLAQGLCECLELPKMAGTDDLTGNFSSGLFSSPFLVVNEGWPVRINGMHPADKFRALVSGDVGKACKKFSDPVDIKSPVRVLFTANNLDVVRMLSAGKDLSPDDREALSVRLLHVNISEEAKRWLILKGGLAFTGSAGRRWIEGDSGEASDFIVAKHFLYLHRNRQGPIGSRFLVEGNRMQDVIHDMRVNSGNTPIVIETIVRMVEAGSAKYRGLTFENGELYVLQDAVLNFYREELRDSVRSNLSSLTISNVLKGLVKTASVKSFELHRTRADLGPQYWQCLDTELLLKVAMQDGMRCKKLQAVAAEQLNRATGVHKEADNVYIGPNHVGPQPVVSGLFAPRPVGVAQ